jgi:23S rRNA (guanine2445-N2)-methyltransferase / 23S rRNA (guanine2069-N7)-methyltransferase
MNEPGTAAPATVGDPDATGATRFFATAAFGTADLLGSELQALGAGAIAVTAGGVSFEGGLEAAYRACLWSRVAMRVLLPLARFSAADADALYAGVAAIDWQRHFGVDDTFVVDFTSTRSALTHTQFGAQRTKDAIVDGFRAAVGRRPSVDALAPTLRINVHVERDVATVSIDLAGDSLHRRGYRERQGPAPLRETLAAAVLLRAGWPTIAAAGGAFVDPMCGSGTLPIEAALIAGDVAPGLLRTRFGFEGWRGHDAGLWQRLRAEADLRRARGLLVSGRIFGFDRDPLAVKAARLHASNAGLGDLVRCTPCELAQLPDAPAPTGLLATNPPYGERLGEEAALESTYAELGRRLRDGYRGWEAAVLTGNPPLGRKLGIAARRTHRMMNGAIECRLLRMTVNPESFETPREPGTLPVFDREAARARPGAAMFANRLRKNLAALRSWARREQVSCYRVYDADMPEYSFAIDLYQSAPEGGERWLYVQEYAPPATVDRDRARARRQEVLVMLPEVFGLEESRIQLRVRRQQRGTAQYEKQDDAREFHVVEEGGLRFEVNFRDYLDTGLFLDHRLTRLRLRELARGKRFLNLFCYTATASVHAAAGGAASTLSLDLSRTYLEWARRNFELNGFERERHALLQVDCLAWLAADDGSRFDLVFLDPPTFSNSKRMTDELDIGRDHVRLVELAMRRVAPGGLLVFSTNFRRFQLDPSIPGRYAVDDVSAATIPKDYARDPRIHRCFEIRERGSAGR